MLGPGVHDQVHHSQEQRLEAQPDNEKVARMKLEEDKTVQVVQVAFVMKHQLSAERLRCSLALLVARSECSIPSGSLT